MSEAAPSRPRRQALTKPASPSQEARILKEDFIQTWNPVASTYGYPTRSPGDI